jgi:hypothetical protein
MATLEKAPTSNFWSTSLNGAINDSVTTITLNSTVGLQAPGRLVINRQDSTGKNTPSAREVISFTGISGSDLTGVTRGADNSTARSHADGSLVESAMVVGNWDALYKVVNQEHSTSGVHSVADMITGGSVIDDDTFATASATKLATSESIKAYVDSGWSNANQTWTREGDNSFSEPIDATLKYQKGDKIRYKQGGGWKYQYIIGVGAYSGGKTIMTTTGGSDYKFDSGTAITDNYYSHASSPIGFPYWFSYTPSYSAKGSMTWTSITTYIAQFRVIGSEVLLYLSCSGTIGGTLSNYIYVTTPVTTTTNWWSSVVIRDGGGSIVVGHAITYDSNIDRIAFGKDLAANFSAGSGGGLRAILSYGY